MPNEYTTIVVRNPYDPTEREAVARALEALGPHKVAMSMEDEMTLLECVEQHDDLPAHVLDEAREQRDRIHAEAAERG